METRRVGRGTWVSWLLAVLVLGPQARPAHGQALDRETIDAIVARVSDAIRQNYVFPEIAARYVAGLAERAQAYPAGMTAQELAIRVTADLRAIHRDLHLTLIVGPPPAAGGVRVAAGGGAEPPSGGGVRVEQSVGGAAGAEPIPTAATPEQLFTPIDLGEIPDIGRRLFADEAGRNHFFRAVEVLPGNVGYLDYDQFGFPNFSTAAADAAFAFLAETDAMIIDLRGNRGGIEGMNQYLATHFFGDDPVHLYSRYYGSARTTVEYMTFPEHVKRRFPDLPLFILVDGATGSAAENFAFALQGLGRATIVGATTAGAAHSSRAFPVEPGFVLQLPIARAFNPRTDEDWEGAGVRPDAETTSGAALEVAHGLAIDRLIEDADDADRLALEDARLLMAARAAEPLDPDEYAVYVGEYGSRRVFLEEGRLRMVRTDVQGVAPVDLVPLAPDYFTLTQAAVARIRFERDDDGRIRRLHVRLPTGAWEVSERR